MSFSGIRGSELLAANSDKQERAHTYAAHFALSHAGWLTSRLGFSHAGWIFACLLLLVVVPYVLLKVSAKRLPTTSNKHE